MKKMIIVVFAIVLMAGAFGNVYAAEIGNTVWNDLNKNGVQDPGEEGIAGVKIKLYRGNDVETDKTNSQGRYKFKDLDDGSYDIVVAQETLPAGCVATYDRDGGKDGRYDDKYVKGDEYYTHADFGYYCPSKSTVVYTSTKPVSPETGAGAVATSVALIGGIASSAMVYKKQKANYTK